MTDICDGFIYLPQKYICVNVLNLKLVIIIQVINLNAIRRYRWNLWQYMVCVQEYGVPCRQGQAWSAYWEM